MHPFTQTEDPQTEEILFRLQQGDGLAKICRDLALVRSTVRAHLNSDPNISARYARARRDGLDAIAEDIERIADDRTEDPDANSRRVRIDARKWLLSKLRPDKYGDAVKIEHSGGIDLAGEIRARREARIIEQRALPGPEDPADT